MTIAKLFTYRNRAVTSEDVNFLVKIIADNPEKSRRALSIMVCHKWNWVQPNGVLKDGICRGLMLKLHREEHIKLPPRKQPFTGGRQSKQKIKNHNIDQTPIFSTVKKLQPIEIKQVRRTNLDKLFSSLIDQYHYLGYTQPVGEHLKYIVFAAERPIACFAFSSAPYRILHRDRFIGWSFEMIEKNRHFLAYNSRFLILPWVHVPHLASHLLAKCARGISEDWQTLYRHPVFWLETFVDTDLFKGICYRAANWIFLGNTSGRGKYNKTQKQLTSIKAMYGFPLIKNFREKLCQ
ncbi:MAG: DUF4338 domain-containing protein [Deltaproteobacteria bacterium]|jgi:hypothetical protein|nr:DUF4338 domain-containing protein [Deltaproteobacteria bacterium]